MFEDGLYYRLGEHADEQAMRIKHALIEAGCNFSFSSSTNQQFPVLSDAKLKKLSEIYAFSYWERVDEHYSMVRICTSWATKTEDVDALIQKDSYPVPPIFKLLAEKGQVEEHVMYNTYNMGIGMIVAVNPEDVDTAMRAIEAAGEKPYIIGHIESGKKQVQLI